MLGQHISLYTREREGLFAVTLLREVSDGIPARHARGRLPCDEKQKRTRRVYHFC